MSAAPTLRIGSQRGESDHGGCTARPPPRRGSSTSSAGRHRRLGGDFNAYDRTDRAQGVNGVPMTPVLAFFDPLSVETLTGFEAAVDPQVGAAVPAG